MKESGTPLGFDGCTCGRVEVRFVGVAGSSRWKRFEQLIGKRFVELLPFIWRRPTRGTRNRFAKCVCEGDGIEEEKAENKNTLSNG